MQCVSCRFENTPDSVNCCRCGTHLSLRDTAVDVHPPRARRWRKRVDELMPGTGFRRGWRAFAGQFGGDPSDVLGASPWSLLWRSVVPGWAHFYLGQKVRGRVFLGLFLFFLACGLLQFGTLLGNVLLGLAMSVHASAVLDILQQEQRGDRLGRVVRAVLVLAVLFLLFYLPIVTAVGSVAGPRLIERDMGPLREGDVLLCNYWAYWRLPPSPGDVVLYQSAGALVTGRTPGGANQQIRIDRGERIDRVIAGPGDRVRCRKGVLLVNGTRSEWQPLNPAVLAFDWELDVRPGHLCIIPSTLLTPEQFHQAWQYLVSIPAQSVLARVYFQLQPLGRLGFVR